jgi:hypothetical protein
MASSSESESDEVKEVSIVTPERSSKKHRSPFEKKKEKELVRFLENRRLNSGYSDDSNVEDVVGHSRPVARRLFADPSPKKRIASKSIDSAQTWAESLAPLFNMSFWWKSDDRNLEKDFCELDFLTAVVGSERPEDLERFLNWSQWAINEPVNLEKLSDYVRGLMRCLCSRDLLGFKKIVLAPPDRDIMNKAMETKFGCYERTILHAIAMDPMVDKLAPFLRFVSCSVSQDKFGLTPLHLLTLNSRLAEDPTVHIFLNVNPSGTSQLEICEKSGACLPYHLFLLADHSLIEGEKFIKCMLLLKRDALAFTEQRSPFLVAASNPIETMAIRSVRCFLNRTGEDINGYTAIHIACSQAMPNLVETLCDLIPRGMRIRSCRLQGSSPLHVAAAGGTEAHAECLRVMMRKLIPSEILSGMQDHENWPPLLYALYSRLLPTVRACVEMDQELVDPTWDTCPQLQFILHLVGKQGEHMGKKKIQKLLGSFVTVPEFFDFLNNFISRDVSRLAGALNFILSPPMGARLLSLENKYKFIEYKALAHSRVAEIPATCNIWVSRPENGKGHTWLSDLQNALSQHKTCQRIDVRYSSEAGYGIGPTREFFSLVSTVVSHELFVLNPSGHALLPANEEGLIPAYRMAGKFAAISLISGARMNLGRVSRILWHYVIEGDIGYVPDVEKLEDWDPEMARSLKYIALADDSPEIEFLLQGANKYQYVSAQVRSRILTSGMKAFREGFFSVFHAEDWIVDLFLPQELAVLFGSDAGIDVHDWRANTVYPNGYTDESKQIVWFWQLVQSMSDEDRRLVLLFATGMTGPPMGGFANMKTVGGDKLKFSILRIIGEAVALPSAATCMNLFRLPEYPSQAVLNEKVLTAIRLGSQGFAFA